MTPALVLDKVHVTFQRRQVLSDVSCSLAGGQVVGLVGPNGAGKSTLLSAISGTLPHTGAIRFGGRSIENSLVGYMPQNTQVRADLTVMEVVLLGRHERLGWRIDPTVLSAAAQILTDFDLAHLAARPISTLSGGQGQLVMLAQRLLREPKLLLLDEATSALDLAHQMRVFALLRAYVARTGALVLFAIHDLNLAARHTDSILLLGQGGLAGAGPFETVVTPSSLRDVYGVEAEFLQCRNGRPVILPLSAVNTPSDSRRSIP
jgi:iron complex transport system ATP-binding protein